MLEPGRAAESGEGRLFFASTKAQEIFDKIDEVKQHYRETKTKPDM